MSWYGSVRHMYHIELGKCKRLTPSTSKSVDSFRSYDTLKKRDPLWSVMPKTASFKRPTHSLTRLLHSTPLTRSFALPCFAPLTRLLIHGNIWYHSAEVIFNDAVFSISDHSELGFLDVEFAGFEQIRWSMTDSLGCPNMQKLFWLECNGRTTK